MPHQFTDAEYRAQFLLEVSTAANSHLDVGEVLTAIRKALQPRVAFDSIGLLIIEGEHFSLHALELLDTPRMPGESVASLVARKRAKMPEVDTPGGIILEIPTTDSCIAEFAHTRRPYVSENLDRVRRYPEEERLWQYGVRSYVSIPLTRNNHVMGAVHFCSERPRELTRDEIKLLEDASTIVSMAVANALAYQEIRHLKEQLSDENRILQDEIDQRSMYEEIVGYSTPLKRMLQQVERVAPTDSTVLLTGETGTGKELVARAIHRRSPRAGRAMVKVNCAALPAELIASELFGHEKGAFTGALQQRIGRFETADGGTIFLDEIGELAPDMQVALLRVLQEREFERVGGNRVIRTNVRVIAATNRDMEREAAEGRFRSDLFYRLNVFPIHCPPLRERREDIPILVEYFMARFASRMGKRIDLIDKDTYDSLLNYSWPGNIRELQNIIERAVILADGRTLRLEPETLRNLPTPSQPPSLDITPADERDLQRAEIEAALRATRGRVSGPRGAALRLGVPASTLESRIRALAINKHAFK